MTFPDYQPSGRWRTGGLVVATVLSLAVAGCAAVTPARAGSTSGSGGSASVDYFGVPAQADQVKTGGALVMALSAEPDKLDPTLSRSLYSRYVFNAMCQKLYDVDSSAKIVPQLATALPTVTDGGKTVTIPVREGVKFADGTAFDAAAVKATFERNLTLKGSGRKSELGPITSVEATDAKTVVVHLSKPFAPLTAALTDRAGMILSPKATKALGKDFANAPVCVGPFKFTKRVPQNSIELSKDPNYYDAAKVHLDSISYRIITDANIRAANLRSGDVKVADSLSAQDVPSLQKEKSLSVLQSQSLGYQGVSFNVGNVDGVGSPAKAIDRPEAKDPRIRQAFELAIDRAGLVKVIFNNLNTVACSPISPKSEFSSEAVQKCTPHDPAKAKALLKEAGVTTPFPIEMVTSNNPDSLRFAQALAVHGQGRWLRPEDPAGGVRLTARPAGPRRLRAAAARLVRPGRPRCQHHQLRRHRRQPERRGLQRPGRGRPAGPGPAEPGPCRAQRPLYAQVVAILHKTDPLIYLYRQRNLTGVSNTLKGVQVFPDGVVRLSFAGLGK